MQSFLFSGWGCSTSESSRCSSLGQRCLLTSTTSADTRSMQVSVVNHSCYHSYSVCHTSLGGFTPEHECVHMFWDVVGEFTEEQKRELLKFVTSCSRRPLLGFKDLHPAFCVLSGGKEDRLPSASTCMNILKLPVFQDSATMKTRLVYAISSGAGFELS